MSLGGMGCAHTGFVGTEGFEFFGVIVGEFANALVLGRV